MVFGLSFTHQRLSNPHLPCIFIYVVATNTILFETLPWQLLSPYVLPDFTSALTCLSLHEHASTLWKFFQRKFHDKNFLIYSISLAIYVFSTTTAVLPFHVELIQQPTILLFIFLYVNVRTIIEVQHCIFAVKLIETTDKQVLVTAAVCCLQSQVEPSAKERLVVAPPKWWCCWLQNPILPALKKWS